MPNGDVKPTPTQLENDLAAMGYTIVEKQDDGSPADPNAPPWTSPPDPEPEPKAKR